jgi:hypothetical protein
MSYKTYTLEELKEIAGKHSSVEILESASGAALVTSYGARILGLFPERSGTNLLWVDKDLGNLMSKESWMVGGERLWIAPERSFFYENPRDFEGHHVPAGLDPGNYVKSGDLVYDNSFPLLDLISNELFEGTTTRRSFESIEDPYRTGLAYAGVRINDSISAPSTSCTFSGWSIAQVYTCGPETAGTALFPLKAGGTILGYFVPIPADRADIQHGYARFKIDADKVLKFAIAPEDIVWNNPCKGVYVSPMPGSDTWFCVVKRSDDLPRNQQECVDVSKADPEGTMGAIQSYNNGPGFGEKETRFGEIEIQFAKGTADGGKCTSSATHELLGYVGSRDQIVGVAQTALGLGDTPELYH